jgi:uncharacterized protein YbaP (TraB family)
MKVTILFIFLASISIGQNSILWQITGEGVKDTSYLYGTIHLPNKKYFYVNQKVHEVKKKVESGAFEIELTQDSLAYISMAMVSKSGSRISDLYSESEQRFIYEYFKKKGLPSFMVNNMKPIALTTMLMTFLQPPDTTGAIDQLLQNDFKKMGKPVIGLESIKMQTDLLLGMPINLQKRDLWNSLNNQDSLKNGLHELDSVYTRQDLEGISRLLDDFEDEEYLNKDLLNDARNLKMVERIPELVKNQSILICVGTVHLCGEDGLIQLLRKKGYTLEPVFD